MKSDHDLLIEVHATVTNLVATTQKIVDDHESRIRGSERALLVEKGARIAQGRSFKLYSTIGGLAVALFSYLSLHK